MTYTLKQYLDADWHRLCSLVGAPHMPRRWNSHFGPRFAPVTLVRCAQTAHGRGWRRLAKLFSLANFMLFNIEVPARLPIGPGLVIPHPQGTVLGASSIGANATIFHQVTLGGRVADFEYDPSRRPVVGDSVTLSVGAKILGPLHLGDGCVVGANAVVLEDVPPGALAIGVPAKIRRQDSEENSHE
ncbi:serine O-acetyltransferase [Herbaspirillum robiniae]|uniref:Serine acetyltransferase n=1 Tax=Herbaspirillum robiniae TaxID=2014887 RepID=A0ABX2LXI3_9BURK|nr:serine acetyltransferase [Herbaspirillum robiniae]NUU03202.1 serine acetyltransferase [Herbaspirillum robiniae]